MRYRVEATNCRVCNIPFDDDEVVKCRDHCHLSSQYHQVLCNGCNLSYASVQQQGCKINVIAHGLSNSHFIIREMHRFKFSCILKMSGKVKGKKRAVVC